MVKRYKVSKDLKGELILSCVPHTLKAGQIIAIQEEQMLSADVQIAIAKKIISPARLKKQIEEPVQEPEVQPQPQKVTEKKSKLSDLAEETKTKLFAYDMEKQELLDQSDSQKALFKRQGIEEQAAPQVGEVNFEDEESVEIKPKKKTKKKARKSTQSKKKAAKRTVNKLKKAVEELNKVEQKSIKPVGEIRQESTGIDLLMDDGDDLSFVDAEQEQQRIANRKT